jgi:type VI secretion system protein ImpK
MPSSRNALAELRREMNERLYQVCAEVLVSAVQLTAEAPSVGATELHRRLIDLLDRMVSDGRRLGVADADLAEARYALVAFIDEQIARSDWAGRSDWMNRLQLELYKENTAGENFFVRLRALLRSGNRPVAVEIYYLCLVLGFEGAYRDGGEPGALEKFARAARDQLKKVLPDPDKVSPHASLKGAARSIKVGWAPLIGIGAGSLLLISIVLLGLGWSTGSRLEELVGQIAQKSAEPGAVP